MTWRAPRDVLRLVTFSSHIIDKLVRPRALALCTLMRLMIISRTDDNQRVQSIIAIRLRFTRAWRQMRTMDTQDPSVARLLCRFVTEMVRLDYRCLEQELIEGGILTDLCEIICTCNPATPAACMAIVLLLHKGGFNCTCVNVGAVLLAVVEFERNKEVYPLASLATVEVLRATAFTKQRNLPYSREAAQGMLTTVIMKSPNLGFGRSENRGNQAAESSSLGIERTLRHLAWLLFHEREYAAALSADILKVVLQKGHLIAVQEGCGAIVWLAAHDTGMIAPFQQRRKASGLLCNINLLKAIFHDVSRLSLSHPMIPRRQANFIFAVLLFYCSDVDDGQHCMELYEICKFIVLDDSAANLLRMMSALISSEILSMDENVGGTATRGGNYALVRSSQGDTKIVLPSADILHKLSPRLYNEITLTLPSTGRLPVLRGSYRTWDMLLNINATSDNTGSVSVMMLLESLKVARCYLCALSSTLCSNALINLPEATATVLAIALKFQLPGLAVAILRKLSPANSTLGLHEHPDLVASLVYLCLRGVRRC